jgi:hypothetical protein
MGTDLLKDGQFSGSNEVDITSGGGVIKGMSSGGVDLTKDNKNLKPI